MQNTYYNALRLGLNIRMRRHVMHLSQAEVARRMGCCKNTLSLIERGKQNISVEMLFKLCRALECSTAELLDGV